MQLYSAMEELIVVQSDEWYFTLYKILLRHGVAVELGHKISI